MSAALSISFGSNYINTLSERYVLLGKQKLNSSSAKLNQSLQHDHSYLPEDPLESIFVSSTGRKLK